MKIDNLFLRVMNKNIRIKIRYCLLLVAVAVPINNLYGMDEETNLDPYYYLKSQESMYGADCFQVVQELSVTRMVGQEAIAQEESPVVLMMHSPAPSANRVQQDQLPAKKRVRLTQQEQPVARVEGGASLQEESLASAAVLIAGQSTNTVPVRIGIACRCHMCGAFFQGRNELQKHMRMMHKEFFPYRCSFAACGLVYTQKCHLTRHIKKQHKECIHPV